MANPKFVDLLIKIHTFNKSRTTMQSETPGVHVLGALDNLVHILNESNNKVLPEQLTHH